MVHLYLALNVGNFPLGISTKPVSRGLGVSLSECIAHHFLEKSNVIILFHTESFYWKKLLLNLILLLLVSCSNSKIHQTSTDF